MTGLVGLHLVTHQKIEVEVLDGQKHRVVEINCQSLELLHVGCQINPAGLEVEKVRLCRPEAKKVVDIVHERLRKACVVGDIAQIDIECAQCRIELEQFYP